MALTRPTGKMLNALHRDCWGCDNLWCGKDSHCTCDEPERTREKRQWKAEAREEMNDGNDR